MANKKLKMKKSLMGTNAIEDLVFKGVWHFTIDGFDWKWDSCSLGINLSRRTIHDCYDAVLHAAKLDHAVLYAWGFSTGARHANAMNPRPEVRPVSNQLKDE